MNGGCFQGKSGAKLLGKCNEMQKNRRKYSNEMTLAEKKSLLGGGGGGKDVQKGQRIQSRCYSMIH